MTQKTTFDDVKEQACTVMVTFRETDKIALADKRNVEKQRAQYKELNNLRAVADKLIEAHHG